MQFVHRVRTIWSWLPAFRAVAETEHLPTAASQLGIVPSSLSRSVKQLEDELGIPLFDRIGKSLVLNEQGRRLLQAVRDAMRVVDESIVAASSSELRGNVTGIASAELLDLLVVPACARLATDHPQLCVGSRVATEDTIASLLVQGEADVAVTPSAPEHPELRVRELGGWKRAVFGVAGADSERFVGIGDPNTHAHGDDGWPVGRERNIVAWTSDELAALRLAAAARLSVVAFEHAARRHPALQRSREPAIAPRTLYVVHRRAVGSHPRTDALVDAIVNVAAELA